MELKPTQVLSLGWRFVAAALCILAAAGAWRSGQWAPWALYIFSSTLWLELASRRLERFARDVIRNHERERLRKLWDRMEGVD